MTKTASIKALIIDDEPRSVNMLKSLLLEYFPDEMEIEVGLGPEEGIIQISGFKPDLVFLDVEMPKMNGFELLSSLNDINFRVVFTTAYDQYAIRAFKFNALDYLLKPIMDEELIEAVKKFRSNRLLHDQRKQLTQLLGGGDVNHLAVPSTDGVIFLDVNRITRCQADWNYTEFFLDDNTRLISSKTLKEYEEALLGYDHFIRVHRSHLINHRFIKQFLNDGHVVMKDGITIPVSRRRKEEVMKQLSK